MIISCYARGEVTPSMMAYTGKFRPKSRRSTQLIFVRGGSASRSNPLPVEKTFYICDWFLFYDIAGFQQLKRIQSSKQGMWKECHLPFVNRRYRKLWKMVYKRLRGGPPPYKNLLSTCSPPSPPPPGCYLSMTLGSAHKCCFKDFEFSRLVRSSDLGCTRWLKLKLPAKYRELCSAWVKIIL